MAGRGKARRGLGLLVIECLFDEERRAAGAINRQWRDKMGVVSKMMGKDSSPQLPALTRPTLSERFAEAHDAVAKLEEKLAYVSEELREALTELKAEKLANTDLRKESTYLADNRDKLLRDNARLATILSSIDKIIDGARAPAPSEPKVEAVAATGGQE